MKKIRLLLACLFLCLSSVRSQSVYPYHLTNQVNQLLYEGSVALEKKDETKLGSIITQIDQKLTEAGPDYNTYRGMISLFLWAFTPSAGPTTYRDRAIELLAGQAGTLVDSLSIGLNNAMGFFYRAGRMNEWNVYDRKLREELARAKGRKGRSFLISGKLEPMLNANMLVETRALASYEYFTSIGIPNLSTMEKLDLQYCNWMMIQCDMAQLRWTVITQKEDVFLKKKNNAAADPEYQRLAAIDFPAEFRRIFSDMDELKPFVMDSSSNRQSAQSRSLRAAWLQLYEKIFDTYFTWAFIENKESYPILPYRNFIYYTLEEVELKSAREDSVTPVIDAHTIVNHYLRLSTLYGNVGNTVALARTTRDGFDLFRNNKLLYVASSDSLMRDLAALKMAEASAYAADRDFARALVNVRYALTAAPKPRGNGDELKDAWDLFTNIRLTEIDILHATGEKKAARDSMKSLLADVADIDDDHGNLLYELPAWNRLQFMVAKLEGASNRWNTDILSELFSWMNPTTLVEKEYMTEARLLYVIAQWRNAKYLDEDQLIKLLFYTGERLRYSFRMLTAAERMSFYEHKMAPIFNLYHELIFSGKLDNLPPIKKEVISQSLSLKAMMADGNMIPNSFFPEGKSPEGIANIENKRRLKREISLLENNYLFKYGEMESIREISDQGQELWLNLIAKAYRDSMDRLTDWRTISAMLRPDQIFTEFVRFNQSLGDSSAWYGVYIIEPGQQITVKKLFAETELRALINDPSASPQNILLSIGAQRGLGKRKQERNETASSWKSGQPDRLANLILSSLQPYLKNTKEWMIVQDGLLNRISFNALQFEERHLFEDHLVQQFSSSGTFLAEKSEPLKKDFLVAGGLEYGEGAEQKGKRVLRGGYSWHYLPATKTEADQIASLAKTAKLKVESFEKKQFPDSMLNKLNDYRFIHLATHGFYLDSAESVKTYSPHLERSVYKTDPLFRCGLAVSGANEYHDDFDQDGYLMGYELANTDLRNCELISLSACETGLGDVRNNLGVDGLPRALKLGGARYLLTSLWKVPDEPTAAFMKEFYRGVLSGEKPSIALQKTQAQMAKIYPVSDWAAFILID